MANRVLLGEHATYGYGLFISKPSIDVTGANKNYFLFDTTAASIGQILVFQQYDVADNYTKVESFNNLGKNTFAVIYYGSTATNYQISIAQNQAYLSLSIERDSDTQSTFSITNSRSGSSSIKATIIIFAENM